MRLEAELIREGVPIGYCTMDVDKWPPKIDLEVEMDQADRTQVLADLQATPKNIEDFILYRVDVPKLEWSYLFIAESFGFSKDSTDDETQLRLIGRCIKCWHFAFRDRRPKP